jgi:hypothetical protein
MGLNSRKAPSDDGVTNESIKNLLPIAVNILSNIYSICLENGVFPQKWKRAAVSMVLKPGKDKNKSSSFRPISLLPGLGKLIEKILKLSWDNFEKTCKIDKPE